MNISLIPVLLWPHPNDLIQDVAILYVMGTLMHVSIVRSIHLPMGVLSSLPLAITLIALTLSRILPDPLGTEAVVAMCATLALLGYFAFTLYSTNEAHRLLHAAQSKAERASDAKSRFLAAMSHEMNTPLTTVLGMSQLMQGDRDRTVRDQAGRIETAARRLRMLVEDALDLAASESDETLLRPVTVSLDAEIRGALPHWFDAPNGPTWTTTPDALPELVRIDPVQLRKCLSHLGQFVQADAAGGSQPRLECTNEDVTPQTGVLCIVLSSGPASGSGQADAATSDVADQGADGSEGIGLELVRRLVGNMGGSVELIQHAGLRRAELRLPYVAVPPLPEAGRNLTPRLRALVIDDLPTNRFVISRLLLTLGIDAVEAESGDAALRLLATEQVDFVLLDMNMPGMDGATTFRALRARPEPWSDLPVIALTADTLARQRDAYMALGLDGYVPKPADRRVLWSEIQQAVSRH